MSTVHAVTPAALDSELRARVIARMQKHYAVRTDLPDIDAAQAGQRLDQTLIYLYVVGTYPEHKLPPSEDVDEPWHILQLYTRAYDTYCVNNYGRRIPHQPRDIPGKTYPNGVADTVAFMNEHGIEYDPDRWSYVPGEIGSSSGVCG